jgi:hypothetical protein
MEGYIQVNETALFFSEARQGLVPGQLLHLEGNGKPMF